MTTTDHAPRPVPPRRSWRRGKKDPSPALRPVEPTAAPHSRAEEHQPTPAPRREKKDRELWGKVAQARDKVADVILPESDDENDEVASYPRWPVMILSGSAFVAIWGGWVALGLMCGFGPVNLLPGIGSGLTVNLAITLPLGMEVYAAYALGAWLTRRRINSKARTFAKWSSLFSLTLGWGGQVVYHLLASRGIEQAPWQVVVAVSGIPVLVLAFGAGLAHLLTVPHKRTRRPGVTAAAPLEDVPAPVTTPVAATVPVVAEAPAPVAATAASAEPAPWGGALDPAPAACPGRGRGPCPRGRHRSSARRLPRGDQRARPPDPGSRDRAVLPAGDRRADQRRQGHGRACLGRAPHLPRRTRSAAACQARGRRARAERTPSPRGARAAVSVNNGRAGTEPRPTPGRGRGRNCTSILLLFRSVPGVECDRGPGPARRAPLRYDPARWELPDCTRCTRCTRCAR